MQTATPETLHKRLQHVSVGAGACQYPLEICRDMAPLINEINVLKKARNAVILAHSYITPEIIYGVADHTGDSYGLSMDALKTDADVIVFAAVRFMAETAKILCPDKEVLLPAQDAGCSLADSITAADVRSLKQEFPDHAMICYINTTAEVKAECDVCVTSSNVYDIVEKYPSEKIFFLPDRLMGMNIIEEMSRRGVQKDIQLWQGACHVHEVYDPAMVEDLRRQNPGLKVISHPECSPGILHQSDFVGSTSQLLSYVSASADESFLMLTECGLTSRIQVEMPEKKFIGSCSTCQFMKSNTLEDIRRVLSAPTGLDRIELDPVVTMKARACIEAMFKYAK